VARRAVSRTAPEQTGAARRSEQPASAEAARRGEQPSAAGATAELHARADADDARFLQRYFKTGPGEYGAGDRFLGIRVPVLRRLARQYDAMSLAEVRRLLRSPFHEARLLALLILARAYDRGDDATRQRVYELYLASTDHINSWDLVDVSAAGIVGRHLATRDRAPLVRLAGSSALWERRIAIVATHHFIRAGDHATTLHIAELLLDDRHDLIHKAVGWMLREVAKRDQPRAETFLRTHLARMPRTTLRYAIERFPAELRLRYLHGDMEGTP
jgi:3-methyladenine DNA glycosylase AlkD